ncbi:hypothetical protein EDD22DRAFT_959138 [Suillus occidentalis]|nr:hypothetical protein EDD22DRAFT_959138 [Suillus occidentalis]
MQMLIPSQSETTPLAIRRLHLQLERLKRIDGPVRFVRSETAGSLSPSFRSTSKYFETEEMRMIAHQSLRYLQSLLPLLLPFALGACDLVHVHPPEVKNDLKGVPVPPAESDTAHFKPWGGEVHVGRGAAPMLPPFGACGCARQGVVSLVFSPRSPVLFALVCPRSRLLGRSPLFDSLSNHRIPPPLPVHHLGASRARHLVEIYQKYSKTIGALSATQRLMQLLRLNIAPLRPRLHSCNSATQPTCASSAATEPCTHATATKLDLAPLQPQLHSANSTCNHATMQLNQLNAATLQPCKLNSVTQLATVQLNMQPCNHATLATQLCNLQPATCNRATQPTQLCDPATLQTQLSATYKSEFVTGGGKSVMLTKTTRC